MLTTRRAWRGMVTAPHHLASEAGLSVLKEDGTAIEAMVAMAAAIAVVYPHMNGIGGDGFWLIAEPAEDVIGIDACGAAAAITDIEYYQTQGCPVIPERGPLAALTVAGTVSGWDAALKVSRRWGGKMPLTRLLEEAMGFARDGIAVTAGQYANTVAKLAGLIDVPGFARTFLVDGTAPAVGTRFCQERLATTLEQLARAGLQDFYRGDLAAVIAKDLEDVGSPLTAADLAGHMASPAAPLSVGISAGTLYNMPPPTQGLASLIILALFDRLGVTEGESFEHVHGLIEATKRAFLVRDRHVTDPGFMCRNSQDFLEARFLDSEVEQINRGTALPWPQPALPGDTVWLGAIDGAGRAVSFIQSLYWEFGSGVVLPESGILWQNRGISFALDDEALNPLMPHRKPFHTLNPALARLADGRVMVYGTMGGEGQPQTQAAIFTRHAMFGQGLQAAVTAPRWLLGRTWGDVTMSLKLEDRFDSRLVQALRGAGHAVELLGPFDDLMGHAGAIVRHSDGLLEGASDPRSDGAAIGF